MIENIPAAWPLRFGFVLTPKFSMISFASAIEALRLANRHVNAEKYAWSLLSVDGQPVANSAGLKSRFMARLTDIRAMRLWCVRGWR